MSVVVFVQPPSCCERRRVGIRRLGMGLGRDWGCVDWGGGWSGEEGGGALWGRGGRCSGSLPKARSTELRLVEYIIAPFQKISSEKCVTVAFELHTVILEIILSFSRSSCHSRDHPVILEIILSFSRSSCHSQDHPVILEIILSFSRSSCHSRYHPVILDIILSFSRSSCN